MSFYNATGEWASVSGDASIISDRSVVSKYYSPALKTWLGDLRDGTHDGSENDPRIGVIKITSKTVTYAISRSNPISRGIEVRKRYPKILSTAPNSSLRWCRVRSPDKSPKWISCAKSASLSCPPGETLTRQFVWSCPGHFLLTTPVSSTLLEQAMIPIHKF